MPLNDHNNIELVPTATKVLSVLDSIAAFSLGLEGR